MDTVFVLVIFIFFYVWTLGHAFSSQSICGEEGNPCFIFILTGSRWRSGFSVPFHCLKTVLKKEKHASKRRFWQRKILFLFFCNYLLSMVCGRSNLVVVSDDRDVSGYTEPSAHPSLVPPWSAVFFPCCVIAPWCLYAPENNICRSDG